MKIVSIITARGGKNIIDLAGKPLIAWTIEASLKSSLMFGAETIKRPIELALDTTEPVIKHVLKNLEEYDYCSQLHLLEMEKTLIEKKALISTKSIDNKILKAFKNGYQITYTHL